jgi:hypothetical protein
MFVLGSMERFVIQTSKQELFDSLPRAIFIKIIAMVCDNFPQLIRFHLVRKYWVFLIDHPLLQRTATYAFYYKNFNFDGYRGMLKKYLETSSTRLKIRNYRIHVSPLDTHEFLWILHSLIVLENLETLTMIGSYTTSKSAVIFPFQDAVISKHCDDHTCETKLEYQADALCCNTKLYHHIESPKISRFAFHQWQTLKYLELQNMYLSVQQTSIVSSMNNLETLILKNIVNTLACSQIVAIGRLPHLKRFEMIYCHYQCVSDINHVIPANLWIALQYLIILCSKHRKWSKNHFELMNSDSVQALELKNYATHAENIVFIKYPNIRSLNLSGPISITEKELDLLLVGMPYLEKLVIEITFENDSIVWLFTNTPKLFTKYGFQVDFYRRTLIERWIIATRII